MSDSLTVWCASQQFSWLEMIDVDSIEVFDPYLLNNLLSVLVGSGVCKSGCAVSIELVCQPVKSFGKVSGLSCEVLCKLEKRSCISSYFVEGLADQPSLLERVCK